MSLFSAKRVMPPGTRTMIHLQSMTRLITIRFASNSYYCMMTEKFKKREKNKARLNKFINVGTSKNNVIKITRIIIPSFPDGVFSALPCNDDNSYYLHEEFS